MTEGDDDRAAGRSRKVVSQSESPLSFGEEACKARNS
jgi:hypothetical protein